MSWLSELIKKAVPQIASLDIWNQALLIAKAKGPGVAKEWLVPQVKRLMPPQSLLEKLSVAGVSAPLLQMLDERAEAQEELEEMIDAMLSTDFHDTDLEDELRAAGVSDAAFHAAIDGLLGG